MKKFLIAIAVAFVMTACGTSTCNCDTCECDACECTVDSISTDTVEELDTTSVVETDSIVNE